MPTLPFIISAEAINCIAEISALMERHNIALEGEHGLKLRKANRIKTIHSSLAFEFIHPFSDGKGRTGRLWQSLILGRLNPLFEHLPVENMVYANQQDYYNAIAASTAEGQSGPFIDFMLNEILKTLQKSIKEEVPNKVPNKSELSVLRLLADNSRLTRIELAQKTGMTENGIKKILANMKAAGWIERVGSKKTGYWVVKYSLND